MTYIITIFAVAFVAILAGFLAGAQSVWIVIALYAAFFIAFTAYAVFCARSSIILETICRIPQTPYIYLTFDDGPDEVTTPRVLDILKEHNIRAIFFVVGSKVEAHPELARRIVREGHEIGLHSYEHELWYTFFGKNKLREDIERCAAVIRDVCGVEPIYYRPPYGFKTPNMYFYLRRAPIRCMAWDVRYYDSVIKYSPHIVKRIVTRVRDGSIILLHDGSMSRRPDASGNITETLPLLIKALRDRGYTCRPLS
ncbi:MAG: polysaccharide deacetylase family protein [Spartobacteria bacterium]|nr:polysaccharide deacetylase family protein [Spartobacteria bacterium]